MVPPVRPLLSRPPLRGKAPTMSTNPIADTARARLREEQAAESAALKSVQRAKGARRAQELRLDAADEQVREALLGLVRISGAERAARLTDESLKALRQLAREAGLPRSQIQ